MQLLAALPLKKKQSFRMHQGVTSKLEFNHKLQQILGVKTVILAVVQSLLFPSLSVCCEGLSSFSCWENKLNQLGPHIFLPKSGLKNTSSALHYCHSGSALERFQPHRHEALDITYYIQHAWTAENSIILRWWFHKFLWTFLNHLLLQKTGYEWN